MTFIKLSLESEHRNIIVPKFGLSLSKNIFEKGGESFWKLGENTHTHTKCICTLRLTIKIESIL